MAGGDEVVTKAARIPVRHRDIMCLPPGVWLTDKAENSFYFWASYFYAVLIMQGYSHASGRQWTANQDVLSSDMMFNVVWRPDSIVRKYITNNIAISTQFLEIFSSVCKWTRDATMARFDFVSISMAYISFSN